MLGAARYKEFKKPKMSYICERILLPFSVCSKRGSEDLKIFREKESIDLSKILGFINDM